MKNSKTKKREKNAARKYAWRPGVWLRNKRELDVQAIGEEIERLVAERGQQLKAKDLVDIARDPASPFHPAIPWDDEEAAQTGREEAARLLLRSYTVRIVRENKPDIIIPANTAVSREDPRKSTYGSTIELMNDEESRALILKQAINRLLALKRSYLQYSELAQVFDAIDRVARAVREAS